MMQPPDIRVLHRHRDDWADLSPVPHSPADYDIERRLAKAVRVFRCDACDERIQLLMPGEDLVTGG